ncbi:MAG: YhdH/YhfP family quinone oxidoreductase [Bdellovibrionales bacterium]|nr:YhdH/YhfP family quinone oxidoreductase [Bdellovibrionales bacterium]
MKSFWALRVHTNGDDVAAKLQQMTQDELTAGEVLIGVHYSSVNYKDALGATGKGKILRRSPLNAGIDAAGMVLESSDPRFQPGQKVIVTGCGIGENDDGGYAELIRVKASSVVPLPEGLTLKEAMILGTAGFTAALALSRMENNHQRPEMGPILVTGASGGVGSFAVQIFSQAGYDVHAVSGKHEAVRYLNTLGAKEVLTPADLQLGRRPLESVKYGGAVDNVGGGLLAQILAHTQLWGNVAAIGLADRAELNTTVMPFILRGVSLLGVSSNNTPMPLRQEIWRKLASEWKPRHLQQTLTRTVGLKDLMGAFDDLLHRRVHGRILVEIRSEE